jgi:hypothetical protein
VPRPLVAENYAEIYGFLENEFSRQLGVPKILVALHTINELFFGSSFSLLCDVPMFKVLLINCGK